MTTSLELLRKAIAETEAAAIEDDDERFIVVVVDSQESLEVAVNLIQDGYAGLSLDHANVLRVVLKLEVAKILARQLEEFLLENGDTDAGRQDCVAEPPAP